MKSKGKTLILVAGLLIFAMVLAGCGKGNGGKFAIQNESGNDVKAAVVKADGDKDFGENLLKDKVKDKAEIEIEVKDASKPVELQLIFKDGNAATFEKVDFKDMDKAKVVVKDGSLVLNYKSKKEGKELSIVSKDFKVEEPKTLDSKKEEPQKEESKAAEEEQSEASSTAQPEASQQQTQSEPAQQSNQSEAPKDNGSNSDNSQESNTEGCLAGEAILN